jgi:hypothetical protein
VVLEYRNDSMLRGAWISLVGLLLAAAALWAYSRQRRTRDEA